MESSNHLKKSLSLDIQKSKDAQNVFSIYLFTFEDFYFYI